MSYTSAQLPAAKAARAAAPLVKIVNDFSVFRVTHNGQCHLRFRLNQDHTDVVHGSTDYINNISIFGVRVPALMWFQVYDPAPDEPDEPPHIHIFERKLRRQEGSHAYVRPGVHDIQYIGRLEVAETFWSRLSAQDSPFYELSLNSSFNTVFPVFRQHNIPEAHTLEMLLGVGFPFQTEVVQTRTYGRTFDTIATYSAFDITEHFIRPLSTEEIGDDTLNFGNKKMFPTTSTETNQCVAFYVGRGARLHVNDRIDQDSHTRSLYQQGSLVVFRGHFRISFGKLTGVSERDFKKDRFCQWDWIFENVLRPQNIAKRNLDWWEREYDGDRVILSQRTPTVWFLGQTESQYNSLSWTISINYTDQYQDRGLAQLEMPENGMIEDIMPWNAGFEMIWARHTYQRLWENVLYWPGPQTPLPEFNAPEEYLIRRMLGIPNRGEHSDETWGPMFIESSHSRLIHNGQTPKIEAQYPIGPPYHLGSYLRDYGEQYGMWMVNTERLSEWHLSDWRNEQSPPPPPLYPPIKKAVIGSQDFMYVYLKPGAQIRPMPTVLPGRTQTFEIDDHQYMLNAEVTPGWQWTDWTQDLEIEAKIFTGIDRDTHEFPNYTEDEWIRWSIDHMKYIKKAYPSSYRINTLYFQKAAINQMN